MAQSRVLFVKFGAQRLVALRLEVPSLKKHIPLISALRMSVRSVKATPRLPRHYVPRNDIRNIPFAQFIAPNDARRQAEPTQNPSLRYMTINSFIAINRI